MTAQEFLDESIASIKLKFPNADGVMAFYFIKEDGKEKLTKVNLHFANLIQCLKQLEAIETKEDFICWVSKNDERYNNLPTIKLEDVEHINPELAEDIKSFHK